VSSDPYAYPGSSVLRNLPGIRDERDLAEFELFHTVSRARELSTRPTRGDYNLKHLQAIHRYLFQDVYSWAGQLRTVDITKANSPFAHHAFITVEAQRLATELAAENRLRGLDQPRFVQRLAYHWGEWNALHPFREGNGRALREWTRQLAGTAGYDFQQHRIDPDQWNRASAASFDGNPGPSKQSSPTPSSRGL
jgi:cell filamentation protein